jgi:putative ABC transport system permease protein
MAGFLQDLRHASRLLRRNGGYTIVAVLVLALGIGANTAIYSVVDALILHPLQFDNVDRIVSVMETEPNQVGDWNELSPANYLDWKRENQSFEKFAVARPNDYNLASGGSPEMVTGAKVSAGYFEILNSRPALGRYFNAEETADGADDRTVVLSYALWLNRFGGDRNVIGRTIRIDGKDCPVIGVAPANMRLPAGASLWTPLILSKGDRAQRTNFALYGIALLKPGFTPQAAQAEIAAVAKRLENRYPETNTGRGAQILPLTTFVMGPARGFLLMQFGAVGFVLLIACANVANLQLAHSAGRRKELAVRFALGAGRARVFRQVITESVLVSLAGGAVGMSLAAWGVDVLRTAFLDLSKGTVPAVDTIGIHWRALLFTFGIAVAAGILTAILPAFRALRPDLNSVMRDVPTGSAGTHRLRQALVVGEVAIAVVLMIGAVLMTRGFWNLLRTGEIHQPESLLTFRITSPGPGDRASALRVALTFDELRSRITALPGVVSVSGNNLLPFSGRNTDVPLAIDGDAARPMSELPAVRIRSTLPDYFTAMKIPIQSGRALRRQDGPDSPRSVVISQSSVRLFAGRDPIGMRVKFGSSSAARTWTVVGVAGNVTHDWFTDKQPVPVVYLAELQLPAREMDFVVRAAGDPLALVPAIRKEVDRIDPEWPLIDVRTLAEGINQHFAGLRYSANLMILFSILAVFLATVGVYAVISYAVAERTHEFGIRMALGATGRQVGRGVLRGSVSLVSVGLVLGVAGAVALVRALSKLIFGVNPLDPATYVSAAVLFLLAAVVAAWIPSRRATRLDPMAALRQL